MKIRQDAWSDEHDLLLAETVLRHIREGSTQLNAFEEVGDKLNRTSAACGFRWNAVIRDKYLKAIDLAKKQRKQRQRTLNQKTRPLYTPPEPSISLDEIEQFEAAQSVQMEMGREIHMEDVIEFLESFETEAPSSSQHIIEENERLKNENELITKENELLQKQIETKEKEFETVQQDYQSLVQIMDRARKMVLFENEEETPSSMFKMDRNGNLERIAK